MRQRLPQPQLLLLQGFTFEPWTLPASFHNTAIRRCIWKSQKKLVRKQQRAIELDDGATGKPPEEAGRTLSSSETTVSSFCN